MNIRSLQPDEVSLHRELILRALRDSPDSFGHTLAEAEAQPLSYWQTLTRSVTEPDRHVMFVACVDETVCGSIYGLLHRERLEAGRVGGMWVDPAWRRQGIGRALLQAVFAWAHQRNLKQLGLWAPAHSVAAVGLYRQAGFRETGHRRPLPSNSSLQILEMECDLLS
jgi:GNAT superfamily N-acetyltransferase